MQSLNFNPCSRQSDCCPSIGNKKSGNQDETSVRLAVDEVEKERSELIILIITIKVKDAEENFTFSIGKWPIHIILLTISL